MIFEAAFRALGQIFSAPFRGILWRSLLLTLVLLGLVWAALTRIFSAWLDQLVAGTPHGWMEAYAIFLAGFGLVIGLAYFIPPVSMLVSSFFLDDVAKRIERQDYPLEPPGTAQSVLTAVGEGLRFAAVTLGVNIIALFLLVLPGINIVAFFLANGLLLGREYFSLAAGRFRSVEETRAMRNRHPATILLCGFLLAFFVAVPILNLLTPLFGTALMVHVHKRLEQRERADRLA
jgi:CysZ protein